MKVGKKIMEKLDRVQKMLTFGEKNKYLNCLITSGAFIISSFSHDIYVLYVTFGVMCGIAQSFSFFWRSQYPLLLLQGQKRTCDWYVFLVMVHIYIFL